MSTALPTSGSPGAWGISLRCCGGSRCRGHLKLPDRLGDRLPDQVQSPHYVEPILHLGPFRLGQDGLEYAAGIRQAYQHDIARVGNLVAEQHPHEAKLNLFCRLAINTGIAARPRHEARQEDETLALGFENTPADQPREHSVANRVPPLGEVGKPGADSACLGCLREVDQRRIKQFVVEWRRTDDRELGEVGINAVASKGQIHQYGPGQDDIQRTRRKGRIR